MAVGAEAVSDTRPMLVLRYLDVVTVLVVALPALALGVPVFGYLSGMVGWVVYRVTGANTHRLLARFDEPRTMLAINLFSAFGRIWLLAIAIVVAGVAGQRPDGLTAAVVIFCAFSLGFMIRVFEGPPSLGPKR